MFYDSFKHTTGSSIIAANEAATVMEDDSVKPSMYEDFTEGAMVAVAESETNYTRLMMGIGITEAVAYSETGEPMVYTESFIGDVVDKIKAFFKKLWDKIKALFKRFVLMFDQYFKSDKDFLKKYKSRILKSSTKDMTFSGYPFFKSKGVKAGSNAVDSKIESADAVVNTIKAKIGNYDLNTAEDALDRLSEKREEMVDQFRGSLVEQNSVDASDFHDELFEYFHGATSKETLSDSDAEMNLSNCIMVLEKSKDAIKSAQKVVDKIGKWIDDAVKTIENEAKSATEKNISSMSGSDDEKSKAKTLQGRIVNTYVALFRDCGGVLTQYAGAVLTALKDLNRQSRAICAKAIVKSGKINEESAGSEYFGGGSFLSSVVFK